jgi:hypothetical protein
MKLPTIENIIVEYHRNIMFYKTGSYPRPMKNIHESKYFNDESRYKAHFEKFIKFVERNDGHIDWKLMIEALADFFKGWFNPMFLSNQKGIKIYKNYIEAKKLAKKEDLLTEVKKNLRFVIEYIKSGNLSNVDEYLTEGQYLIPSIGKHLSSGSISPYFLVIVPDIKSIINALPPDMKNEYFEDFLENYDLYRAKILRDKTLRKLSDKFYKIVNSKLN